MICNKEFNKWGITDNSQYDRYSAVEQTIYFLVLEFSLTYYTASQDLQTLIPEAEE